MTPLNFFYGLNIIAYIHDSYLFLYDEKLSTKQKIWGILPRAFGFAIDCSMLSTNSSSKLLGKASSSINALLPASDAVAKESSYIDAGCAVAANVSRLGTGKLPEGFVMLVTSAVDKQPIFKKGCLAAVDLCKSYGSNNLEISLPDTERIRLRIQEAKTQYLAYFQTEEIKLVFIQQDIQNYQNILNNVSADHFGSIPYYYANRPEFRKRKCRISNQIVREAIVIKKTNLPIYYECDHLSGWYKYKRGTFPPAWPPSILFNRDAIIVDKVETAQITESLQKALDQTQNNPEELESVKIGLTALQELLKDFTTPKVTDKE